MTSHDDKFEEMVSIVEDPDAGAGSPHHGHHSAAACGAAAEVRLRPLSSSTCHPRRPAPAAPLLEEGSCRRCSACGGSGVCNSASGDAEPREDVDDTASLHKFWHRAGWLVCLLMCQSTSSVILEHFEILITTHPVVIYFLTMLVGAGGEDFHAPDCWRRGLNWCSAGICAVLRFLCSLRSLSGSWPRGCRHLLIDARDRLHLDAYWSSLARVDEPIWHRPCPRRGDHPSRDGYQWCDADMYRLLPRLGVAIDGRHPLVGFCQWLNSTRAQLRQSNEFSEESQWLRWRRSGGEHHTLGTR
mmetsp:Transcript_81989/g.265618  ORF Transcript_81989/g.265618 Transcript_81989/m.265618 type:complete len:300 (-) Transcript_81989:195-1094(-)